MKRGSVLGWVAFLVVVVLAAALATDVIHYYPPEKGIGGTIAFLWPPVWPFG